MSNLLSRDKNRRLTFKKFSIKQIQHKAMLQDQLLPYSIKEEVLHKSVKLPRNSRSTRIRNRCFLTGRGRAISRFCKLSRIQMRELASQGLCCGISKASW